MIPSYIDLLSTAIFRGLVGEVILPGSSAAFTILESNLSMDSIKYRANFYL